VAANPLQRRKNNTDASLIKLANSVWIRPPLDGAVFYCDDEGAALAEDFLAKHPSGFTRLDELLIGTPQGSILFRKLTEKGKPWSAIEEVWWELSWRMARAARGVVNVFVPPRLIDSQTVDEEELKKRFRHKYTTGAYAHTVFEMVELPELEANVNVTAIYINGKLFS
jgi:hypothetical protein